MQLNHIHNKSILTLKEVNSCKHVNLQWSTYDSNGCIENYMDSWDESEKDVLNRKKKGRQKEIFSVVEYCKDCNITVRKKDY